PAASREPVHARKAMVVSAEPHATRVGVAVLKSGGNAVDAAVAVGLTLAVTHPLAGNIGGGGFMLIRFADGRATFIDFRERAPQSATRDMYLDAAGKPTDQSVVGYRASGVPGTVRGLGMALEKYGSKKWRDLVKPAQRLADSGFPVTFSLAKEIAGSSRLPLFEESQRIFLKGSKAPAYGDILRQRDLAKTLARLAEQGPDEFYTGRTAELIARDMERHGGLITLADLRDYKPVEREPLRGAYRGYGILSAPPPSSGGVGVIQMLNMLEPTNFAAAGPGSAAVIHQVAEAMRRYFADRAAYFGDTDFIQMPTAKLLDKEYARSRYADYDPAQASTSTAVGPGLGPWRESYETTHFSVVDEHGNAVAVTYTLNGLFGSGVTIAGTGIVMNNEMDDFTAKVGEPNMYGVLQSPANGVEPGKRPLSAMTPTIVVRDGKPFLVTGAPGGPTIISTVLQNIINVIDFGMDAQAAADAPRFHHQWMPDELRMESEGFSPDTVRILEAMGHRVRLGSLMGKAMNILATEDGWSGAADSRSAGLAAGY
ncbi:MAG: gamma-glutamyltransferase, partial [Acidobacteria bacterium]|nr:gamma-glutamyltransferase [Acidobacteriota bacterium]